MADDAPTILVANPDDDAREVIARVVDADERAARRVTAVDALAALTP